MTAGDVEQAAESGGQEQTCEQSLPTQSWRLPRGSPPAVWAGNPGLALTPRGMGRSQGAEAAVTVPPGLSL